MAVEGVDQGRTCALEKQPRSRPHCSLRSAFFDGLHSYYLSTLVSSGCCGSAPSASLNAPAARPRWLAIMLISCLRLRCVFIPATFSAGFKLCVVLLTKSWSLWSSGRNSHRAPVGAAPRPALRRHRPSVYSLGLGGRMRESFSTLCWLYQAT